MKRKKESQKETKKQITLCGNLISPLSVGCPAVFTSGGTTYRTSRVAVIHQMTAGNIHFETKNTHYHLILNPYPIGAIIPMHMEQALSA